MYTPWYATPNILLPMRVNTHTDMVRPKIDLEPEIIEKVEQYAVDNGLRMPRAWAELVRAGLTVKTDHEVEQ
jgi:hypothetical protein